MLLGRPLRCKTGSTIRWLRLLLTRCFGILFWSGGCFCEVLCYPNRIEFSLLKIRSVVALGSYKYLTSIRPRCLWIRTPNILICLKKGGQLGLGKIEMVGGRVFCFGQVIWWIETQVSNFQKNLTDYWGLLNLSWKVRSDFNIRVRNQNNGPTKSESWGASLNQNVVQKKAINQLVLCSRISRRAPSVWNRSWVPYNPKTSISIYHLRIGRLKSFGLVLTTRLLDSSNTAVRIVEGPEEGPQILLRSNRTKKGQLIGSLSSKMQDTLFLIGLRLLREKGDPIHPNLIYVLVLSFFRPDQQLTSNLNGAQKTACQRFRRNQKGDWRAVKSEEDTKNKIAESLIALQSDCLLGDFREVKKKDPFGLLKRIKKMFGDLTKHALPFCLNTMILLFQLSWINSTRPEEANVLAAFLKEETLMILKTKRKLELAGRSDFMTFEDISSNLKTNNQKESGDQICLLQAISLRLGGILTPNHFKMIEGGSLTAELITKQKREESGLHELILKVGSLSIGCSQFRGAIGPSVILSPLHPKICFLFGSSFLKKGSQSIQTTTKLALLVDSQRLLDLAA